MFRRFVIVLSTLIFSLSILFVSILRVASVKYSFSKVSADFLGKSENEQINQLYQIKIDYPLVYPGDVLPGSILWPIKAARDKLWLILTTNKSKKAELNILFADKRLGAARILFENKKYEIGLSTLTKAEKYLETASDAEEELRNKGENTSELAGRLEKAALKHIQVIKNIILLAPDDAKPKIIEIENYPKRVFDTQTSALRGMGLPTLENPFK